MEQRVQNWSNACLVLWTVEERKNEKIYGSDHGGRFLCCVVVVVGIQDGKDIASRKKYSVTILQSLFTPSPSLSSLRFRHDAVNKRISVFFLRAVVWAEIESLPHTCHDFQEWFFISTINGMPWRGFKVVLRLHQQNPCIFLQVACCPILPCAYACINMGK